MRELIQSIFRRKPSPGVLEVSIAHPADAPEGTFDLFKRVAEKAPSVTVDVPELGLTGQSCTL